MDLPWLALLPGALAPLAFVRRRLPLELAVLCLLLAAVLAGWLSPSEALAGFAAPAVLTVVAMFGISAAVVRCGALAPIERWLARFEGTAVSHQVLLLAVVVGPLSAVISNTAVVAMFIPVVERRCRRLGSPPSRLLMPLSFLTVLAGMGTVLGTSTTLVASGLAEQLGYGSFGLLQFTPLALLLYPVGALLLAFVAPRVLPADAPGDRADGLAAGYGLQDYLGELRVAVGSPLVLTSLEESGLQHSFDVRVLALIRGGERLPSPIGGCRPREGDVLVLKGRRESLLALHREEGLELVPEAEVSLRPGVAAEPEEVGQPALERELELAVVEGLVPAGSRLIGQSLREIRFAQRFGASVLAIRQGEELLRDRLGQVRLGMGDALLLQTPRAALRALQASRELLLAEVDQPPDDRRDRLPWALLLIGAMLLLSVWRSQDLVVWALLALVGLVALRVLTPQELYAAVRWDVVVLLAALLPLARLLDRSGLDRWLVELLVAPLRHWPPYGVLIGLYLLTALITELVSNQAAVTLMLPLGLVLSQGVGLGAHAALAVITFAASHSFLTPIGYQTNTMVYALGNYSFLDFLRLGLPLTLAMSLLTPALALVLSS